MHVSEMISTHPQVKGEALEVLIRCIEECYACAQTCTSCADACLGEEDPKALIDCIRKDLDCADICAATGAMASRRTGSNAEALRAVLGACAEACRLCAEECRKHADMHQHCKVCAEACRDCEQACRAAMEQVH